jgi:hypothetical protein
MIHVLPLNCYKIFKNYQSIEGRQAIRNALHDVVRTIGQTMTKTPVFDPLATALDVPVDAVHGLFGSGHPQLFIDHLKECGAQDAVLIATHPSHPPAARHPLHFRESLYNRNVTENE